MTPPSFFKKEWFSALLVAHCLHHHHHPLLQGPFPPGRVCVCRRHHPVRVRPVPHPGPRPPALRSAYLWIGHRWCPVPDTAAFVCPQPLTPVTVTSRAQPPPRGHALSSPCWPGRLPGSSPEQTHSLASFSRPLLPDLTGSTGPIPHLPYISLHSVPIPNPGTSLFLS